MQPKNKKESFTKLDKTLLDGIIKIAFLIFNYLYEYKNHHLSSIISLNI
jgi:hypothetical protein